jgi:transposase, IS5 family
MDQYTFFGDHNALEALTQQGDRLVELDRHIQWGALVDVADKIWRGTRSSNTISCGPKPWSSEVMLRILVLKRLYNLSDEQAEYQIRDRLSFMRFVKIGLGDSVPDSRTIWMYSNQLAEANGARSLFDTFNRQLAEQGLIMKEGVMVDATFVEVPRQRNSPNENELIKNGVTPEDWKNQPRKLAQKDVDAQWAKKGDETHYGYKDHIKVGVVTKFIQDYTDTPASTHDSQELPNLISKEDSSVHADSAYSGKPIADDLIAKGVVNNIHEKANRGHPLNEKQKNRIV